MYGKLQKSAAKILAKEKVLRESVSNADEIEGVIWELRKVLDEASDYSARFAKQVAKTMDDVSSKIKNYEEVIKKLDYEEGMLLNNAKKIEISKVTQKAKSSISWGHIPDEKFINSTITHNHPSGSGLSLADIKMFIGTKLNEIRAVTPEGTIYSIKNKLITDKKRFELLDKIEEQEKFAKATFPNTDGYFIDAYVFRVIWNDIKDLVEYTHYIN